jgi:hypothetical protein
MSEKEITEIIDELFIEGLITEENNRIKYEME